MKKIMMLTTNPAMTKFITPGSKMVWFLKSVSLQIKMMYAAGSIFGKNNKKFGRNVVGKSCPEKSLLNCSMKNPTGSPSFKKRVLPTVMSWNPKFPKIKIAKATKMVTTLLMPK